MKEEIKNIKYLKDYVFVKVNSELNDVAGFIKDEHGNSIELKLNPHWKPTEHATMSYVDGQLSILLNTHTLFGDERGDR